VFVLLVTVGAAACAGARGRAGQQQAPVKRAAVSVKRVAGHSIRRKLAAAPPRMAINPLRTRAMRAYVSGRSGVVTAAVEDLRTGQTWTYHPGDREQTGSIIKVDILETLLRQAELSHSSLDSDEAALVQGMIEDSDNDDAQDLWSLVGESAGIDAYDAKAGLTQTVPNTEGYWGETTTSALDQLRLLRELVMKHSLLNVAFKHYELGLMEHVEADQAWGVSAGRPVHRQHRPEERVAAAHDRHQLGNQQHRSSEGQRTLVSDRDPDRTRSQRVLWDHHDRPHVKHRVVRPREHPRTLIPNKPPDADPALGAHSAPALIPEADPEL
jgi:hypothetical protein